MERYDNYVFQIIESGSLTKAAEALGISQPALSLGLNKLENKLGFKIFNRRTVPLQFTAEGQIYYEYIQRVRVLQEDFTLRTSALREAHDKRVVIGGPEVYTGGLVTAAVKKLLTKHPDYSVSMKSASVSQLIDLAANREIDCFISTTDRLPANFVKLPVKKETIYLCIPRKNPLNKRLQAFEVRTGGAERLMDFSCLDGEEFVFLEEWQPLQKILRSFLAQHAVRAVNRTVVNQVATLLNMSAACGSLCVASEDALACNGNREQFCLYLLPDTVSGRLIYVAYDKDLYVSEATGEFIRLLTETGGETK